MVISIIDGETQHETGFCPMTLATGQQPCRGDTCAAYRYRYMLSVDNPSQMPGEGIRTRTKVGYCGLAGKP